MADKIQRALEWYGEQASAAQRALEATQDNALLAIVTTLSLDNGNRAKLAMEEFTKPYHIGPITTHRVFQDNGIPNMSDMQAVMDAVEKALETYATPKEDYTPFRASNIPESFLLTEDLCNSIRNAVAANFTKESLDAIWINMHDLANFRSMPQPFGYVVIETVPERASFHYTKPTISPEDIAEFGIYIEPVYNATFRLDELPERTSPQFLEAEKEFQEYFSRNYPGPNTTIYDPNWHSPKLFWAAFRALASVVKKSSLCPDEGCDHHGTPHVCNPGPAVGVTPEFPDARQVDIEEIIQWSNKRADDAGFVSRLLVSYASRLFNSHGFMLREKYKDDPAVTITFPDDDEADKFHAAMVGFSRFKMR